MDLLFDFADKYRELIIVLLWIGAVGIIYIEYLFLGLLRVLVAQWLGLLVILPIIILQFGHHGDSRWLLAIALTVGFGAIMIWLLKVIKGRGRKRLNMLRTPLVRRP